MVYYRPMENGASRHPAGWRTFALPHIIILLAALLAMAWQFIFPGYYNKILEDAAYTQKYIIQFMCSFKDGVYYPRWMPDNFGGYGSPVFVFYSPLLYFGSALLGLIGFGPTMSMTLIKLAGLFTGGLFLFLFAKKHLGGRAALLSAILYVLLPTRILFLYFINTPAGRFGEAFMPISLYFMQRYMENGFRRRYLFGLAVSYSALILSHLATAYLFTPFLGAYGLIVQGKRFPKAAPRVVLGLASGILLSSFFFIPVLFERGLVQLDFLEQYSFMKNFIFNLSGITQFEKTEQLRVMLGKAILGETAMAVAFLYIAKRQGCLAPSKGARFMAVSAGACLFMMSSLSSPIWGYVPGMHSVAFPARFAPVYIIFVSVLLGAGLDGLLRSHAGTGVITGLVASLFLAVLAYDALLVVKSMPPVSEADARKLSENQEMLEYLPVTVDQRVLPMLRADDSLLSSADVFTYRVAKWGFADRHFTVDSARGARLRVKTFYFPGWRAWVDGKETALSAEDGTGAILVDVPAGRHEVGLQFTDTPPRTIGKIVSLLTLIALAFPYGWLRRRAPAKEKA